jgi:hypothetical protein
VGGSQNGSGAHPVSYPMGTTSPFTWGEADHSSPSSAEVKECVELYLRFPNTPSWRGAQFKKGYFNEARLCSELICKVVSWNHLLPYRYRVLKEVYLLMPV